MTKMKIYGDLISGNCQKVKWTADLLGLPYDWIETSVLEGQTRTDDFLNVSPAGQVPIVVLATGEALAQSNAIVLYLARICNSPLLPENDYDFGLMLQWMFWEQYSHEPAIAVRRFQKHFLKKQDEEIDPALLAKGNAALQLMDNELAGNKYFVGNGLTAADIALVAYTRLAGEGGFDLEQFPNIKTWISRVETDLHLAPV